MNNNGQEQQFELHWYPGHMAKWDKAFNQHLQTVDVVIEVLDARMPASTRHHEIRARVEKQQKPLLTLLNKKDLADPPLLDAWRNTLQHNGETVLAIDALRDKKTAQHVIKAVLEAGKPVQKRWMDKGLKARPIRTMMMGMPNVGKSSLINGLIGRKKVQTGHKAGVTRQTQWVRIHPQIELLDSPGILPPKLENQAQAYWLALISSMGEAAFDDEEVARFALTQLLPRYGERIQEKYGALEGEVLETLAQNARLFGTGGIPDAHRAAQRFLTDLRQGALGGLCFETPWQYAKNTD